MKLINLLIFALSAFKADPEWTPIEKRETVSQEEIWEDQDRSIWPIFAKEMGSEKILVRFPADPTYRYLSSSEMEITAANGEETSLFRILNHDPQIVEKRMKELAVQPETLILEIQKSSDQLLDSQYFSNKKWVAERILLTNEHVYVFQTSSEFPLSMNHRQFIDSFDLENR